MADVVAYANPLWPFTIHRPTCRHGRYGISIMTWESEIGKRYRREGIPCKVCKPEIPTDWETDGMTGSRVDQEDAVDTLGLSPQELDALSDYARREAWVWRQLAKHPPPDGSVDPELAEKIAGFMTRRGRRWKELAAQTEKNLSDDENADST